MPSDALAVLDAIPTEQIPAAITRLSARLMTPIGVTAPDDQLTVTQTAKLLNQSRRWVCNHVTELGGSRMNRKTILFSRRTVLARVARKGRRS